MIIEWSGINSNYSEDEVKKYVPIESGVYLLWEKLAESNKWLCFYVGKTKGLEKRLLEHLSDNEDNDCIKKKVAEKVCGFEYAKVANQNERDGIEKFLYDHYNPSCNVQDLGGKPIEVNLPLGSIPLFPLR